MIEAPSIQWFPGHMKKTERMIKKNLPLVDGVVEILDARIPVSSRNPNLGSLIEEKPRLVLLNKCDSADERANSIWINYYKNNGVTALPVNCKTGNGLQRFVPAVNEVLSELIRKNNERGMSGRLIHLMVVGIPNVGKSSFINKMAGTKKAAVEDRPGVTREKQWVRVGNGVELLDMPGVLSPKFEDKNVGERLAFTGAIKDDIVDTETLACRLLMLLNENYHDLLAARFKQISRGEKDGYELLLQAGKSRGMLISGGEINTERAALTVLDEFRSGKLGRITLELP